jgi:hypothetical protein
MVTDLFMTITLHAVHCIQHGQFLFVNSEVFHSIHFYILDISGHLVGVSEEISFCEVQLNYNAEVHFMAALFYKTWCVMNVEVYHGFYCVLNISVKCICGGLKL